MFGSKPYANLSIRDHQMAALLSELIGAQILAALAEDRAARTK